MSILRNENGQFANGNSYWLGKKGIKKPNSGSFKKGLIPWNKGKSTFKNCERCGNQFNTNRGTLTKPHQRFCSRSCATWKNGNTSIKKRLWSDSRAREWRKLVKIKDGNKCVICGSTKKLHCDHIKPQKRFPELKFDINNGRVLCFECHKKTETYGNKY